MRGSGALGDNTADLTTLEQEAQSLDVTADVYASLVNRGLSSPPKLPGFNGEMPSDITSLDDDELGDLLNKMSLHIGWVEFELMWAHSRLEIATSQYEYKYSRVRLSIKAHTTGKLTDKDRSDYVVSDDSIREAKKQVLFAEAFYRITKNIRDQAQRHWDTISRRITQRGQEVERMKRESSVAGVGAYNARTFQRPTPR